MEGMFKCELTDTDLQDIIDAFSHNIRTWCQDEDMMDIDEMYALKGSLMLHLQFKHDIVEGGFTDRELELMLRVVSQSCMDGPVKDVEERLLIIKDKLQRSINEQIRNDR